VLKRGGVLMADHDRLVRPQEIMRLLVIAIYRHRVLLGELAPQSGGLDAATKALMRRPAPPNHWSHSWIDIALGAAYWAQGKHDLATPLLTRGLLVGNGFDHGLTSWGLIILGRMALEADQPQRAAELFEEATYAAADFGDVRALEEAFALAATAHALAGTRGVPPVIARGCDQLRGELPALHARLVAIEAEDFYREILRGRLRAAALVEGLDIEVGFHAHNNLGLAVANPLAAVECGATIVDATARGFGAGAGNTPLELIAANLHAGGVSSRLRLLEALDAADLAEATFVKDVPANDSVTIASGIAGVFSGFAPHVRAAAERVNVDPREILFELGRRGVVAGQEDTVIEVALLLAEANGSDAPAS
jgi:tetratricopeptide (TPR) repeat protein